MADKKKADGLLPKVRDIYEKDGLDAVWAWAMKPKEPARKADRFAAAARLAGNHKANEKKKRDREAWEKRQKSYRAERDKFRRKARRKAERKEDSEPQPFSTAPGAPHWGGSGDLMAQVVEPFLVKRGLPIGSGKRTPAENAAVGGSPSSDHLTTRTTTMARDFPTYSGEDDARALAESIGYGRWVPNSYSSFVYSWRGVAFRVQILWGGGVGHSDHVHVGISRL